jgi:hypothetical protein
MFMGEPSEFQEKSFHPSIVDAERVSVFVIYNRIRFSPSDLAAIDQSLRIARISTERIAIYDCFINFIIAEA